MLQLLAALCLAWYVFILVVCTIGIIQIWKNFRSPPKLPISFQLPLDSVPHVTILRPVKGVEPHLHECLASTFRQGYALSKFTVHLCIASRNDPAYTVLESVISEYPECDVRIFVEEDDPHCLDNGGPQHQLGPNPKIRNMSRGYRNAKGDIVWIIDCNVWVGALTLGSMVDGLCGFSDDSERQPSKKYKFVHQLPLVYDVTTAASSTDPAKAGTALEEMFLSTSHAKFYTAISAVAVAPCIVGKSNMFRRSHLNALTSGSENGHLPGIDYFSSNICEDHLIGDLLWKSPVPEPVLASSATEGLPADSRSSCPSSLARNKKQKWGNHLLIPSCLAIQPMSSVSLNSYIARRTRWLRVRKFTVPVATLIEPGIESIICSLYGAVGLTTYTPCHTHLGIPRTWTSFATIWLLSMVTWMLTDWIISRWLLGRSTYGGRAVGSPTFSVCMRGPKRNKRMWGSQWIIGWVMREVLALRIWLAAVAGGNEVSWRGSKYRVSLDARVVEIKGDGDAKRDS